MSNTADGIGGDKKRLRRNVVIAILVLIVLVAFFLAPRYQQQVATVDNAHRWSAADAPPRREIIWQPATPISPGDNSPDTSESSIRPQLAESGRVLYYTIRSDDDRYDIVRSRRVGERWTDPQTVSELNSAGNDIGPVLRADGKVLYLYSDRQGGLGGMDLYVSRRDGDRWTKPRNLGTRINSPAHEYDPAISPDGSRLFFSSNRSESIHQRMAEDDLSALKDHWTTTLRTDLGNRTFDLYVAVFDRGNREWELASPLSDLNTELYNEGSPFVSDDGAFLVFSSDRPRREGEARNYDIYRSRIDLATYAAENLGPGVNSSANEIEPSLAGAGFQIVFSRSLDDDPSHYGLFQSTAKEVYHDRQWETSRWQAFSGAVATGLRRVVDRVWWILLIAALLAALVWLLRQLTLRRIALPGFLLAALAIHLLLVTSSFFVFFQDEISDRLRQMFEEETVVASQVLLKSTAPQLDQQPTFDQVADLEIPESTEPAEIGKQATTPASAAIEQMQVVTPKNQARLTRDLPADAVVATAFVQPSVAKPQQELSRRSPQAAVAPPEQISLEETVAVDAPGLKPVESIQPEIEPQPLELIEPVVETVPPEVAPRDAPAPSEESETPPEMISRISETLRISIDRAQARDLQSQSGQEVIETASIAGVDTPDPPSPKPASVALPLPRETTEPALAQPKPIAMVIENQSAPEPVADDSSPQVVFSETALASGRGEPELSLKRSPRSTRPIDRIAESATIVPPAGKGEPIKDAALPRSAAVDVARQAAATPAAQAGLITPVGDSAAESARTQPSISDDHSGLPTIKTPINPVSLSGNLTRRRSFKASDAYADTSVNLRSLLRRRKLNASTKSEVVKKFGGNDQTLTAIKTGLNWIEQHQHSDGHWGLHDFHVNCKGHKRCSGNGGSKSDTAGTGLALLPFLGDGSTHLEGAYKDLVGRGITWLVSHQKPDGDLFTGGQDLAWMYSHGIATIALCECYGMSGDAALRGPAQRAIDFIVAAQDPKTGGWRYRPRTDADTSVVGWQVMALKSGQMAELNVPPKSLKEAERWLESMSGKGARQGQFAYQRGRFNPAMSAEALLCLEYFGADRDAGHLKRGADYLLANLPKKNRETSYYWYYGTQAMFHLQGEHWQKWNEALHPLLIETQQKKGQTAGTWDAKDNWERSGGRIYATSLRLLMLEVYYRHLPLYRAIE